MPFAEPKNDLFLFYGKGRPGVIRGLDLNIKSSNEHMVPIEDLVNPRAIDYHAESGHVYFADTTSFLIGRQKIDGTGRETILKDGGLNRPSLTPSLSLSLSVSLKDLTFRRMFRFC